MIRKAKAISYGAITVINAIASGIGSAIGIDLWTKAEVEINSNNKIIAEISGQANEDTSLIKECVKKFFQKFKINDYGAKIKTSTSIPIARGLKSSSAASNAVTLALAKALNMDIPDIEIIKIGVEASIDSGVSITGAFDDATASYFGGIVLTNNLKKELILRKNVNEDLRAVLFIPEEKTLTKSVNVNKIKLVKNLIEPLVNLVKNNRPYLAMMLNGFIYGTIFNVNPELLYKSLQHGALGASVSGTGPSFASIIDQNKVDKLVKDWSNYNGEIKIVKLNNRKAHQI
jgi:shikimate kinase